MAIIHNYKAKPNCMDNGHGHRHEWHGQEHVDMPPISNCKDLAECVKLLRRHGCCTTSLSVQMTMTIVQSDVLLCAKCKPQ